MTFGPAKILGQTWRFSDFTFEFPTVETYDPENPVKCDLTTVARYTPAAA